MDVSKLAHENEIWDAFVTPEYKLSPIPSVDVFYMVSCRKYEDYVYGTR